MKPFRNIEVTNPKGRALTFHNSTDPDRGALVNLYHNLYKDHPHHLLPLETKLPCELEVASRDQYRIVITMILSERSNDHSLSKCLGRLFHRYPGFENLRFLSKQQIIEKILAREGKGGCGFGGYNKPNGGGNDERLSTFLNRYFAYWNKTITKRHINDLEGPKPTGFGPKFVRTLLAYCPLGGDGPADNSVLPLDRPAFKTLNDCLGRIKGRYRYAGLDAARDDIEHKLGDDENISLINFHELLRFRGQTDSKRYSEGDINKVIIGWNAWRLLCSKEREEITKDRKWIHKNLVDNDEIAEKLWGFVKNITSY